MSFIVRGDTCDELGCHFISLRLVYLEERVAKDDQRSGYDYDTSCDEIMRLILMLLLGSV